jgi:hypothetical protein
LMRLPRRVFMSLAQGARSGTQPESIGLLGSRRVAPTVAAVAAAVNRGNPFQ